MVFVFSLPAPSPLFWQALQLMTHPAGKLPFITVWVEWQKRAAGRADPASSLCLNIIVWLRPKNKAAAARGDGCAAATQFVRLFLPPDGISCPSLKRCSADYRRDVTWLISLRETLRRGVKIMMMRAVPCDPRLFFPWGGFTRRLSDSFGALGVCFTMLATPHLPQHDSKWQMASESKFHLVSFRLPRWTVGSLQHFPQVFVGWDNYKQGAGGWSGGGVGGGWGLG